MRSSSDIDDVVDRCLHLLIEYASYKHLIACFENEINQGTRYDLVMKITRVRVVQHSLVMAICLLDEDGTSISLRTAYKSVRNNTTELEKRQIQQQLKDYRTLINPLKTKVRNKYLAHMQTGTRTPYVPDTVDYRAEIRAALEVLDSIIGERRNYLLKVGSIEPEIDLRVGL